MSKKSSLTLPFAHERDDVIFACHIADLARTVMDRHRTQSTKFLSDRQRIIAQYALSVSGNPEHGFFGGYPDAERTVLVIVSDNSNDIDELDYSISPILIEGSGYKSLSHRDYLGSVLSLGLERELTGDIICPDRNSAVLFACSSVSDYIVSNLTRISNDSVRCRLADKESDEYAAILSGMTNQYEKRSETIPSMRLDAVCAAALGVSRTKAEALIESGGVEINHFCATGKDTEVNDGDRLSVRGFGKYRIGVQGGLSKKGRLWIDVFKYI